MSQIGTFTDALRSFMCQGAIQNANLHQRRTNDLVVFRMMGAFPSKSERDTILAEAFDNCISIALYSLKDFVPHIITTMKTCALLLCVGSALAFAPAPTVKSSSVLKMSSISIKPDGSIPPHKRSTIPKPVREVNWMEKATMKDVVLDPDYTLTWAMALLGGLIIWYHPCK